MPSIADGKYVIAGGASLLGSHIGEQLLAGRAREVVLLDNLSLGSTEAVDFLLADPRCHFLRADILRLNELYDAFENADGVFAVAGFLGAPMSANPWAGLDVNVRGLQNILEASRYRGVRKVVFSSSVGIFGEVGDEPNTDESPFRWSNVPPAIVLYCASKITGEALGRLYYERYGLDFLALRYTAIYGERLHKRATDATRLVLAYERIRSGQPPIIDGDGTQVQDYIYVGDAARANLMAMESAASGEGINIASGIDTSLNDAIRLLSDACGSDLKAEHRNDPRLGLKPVKKQGYSRAKAKRLLGWEPDVSMEEGLRRLVSWLDRGASSTPTM